jgi:seryl-tRNA synthetase
MSKSAAQAVEVATAEPVTETPVVETPKVEAAPKQVESHVEDVKPVEPKAEDTPPVDPKVTELEAEIAKLQAQIEAAKTKDLQLQEVSKQVEELNKSIKEAQVYKDTVANTLKTKIESIPEDKRSIVPEGTDIQKLEWIANAEKLGIFAPAKDSNVEIGKPFNPKTGLPDLGKMSPQQLIASYFTGSK